MSESRDIETLLRSALQPVELSEQDRKRIESKIEDRLRELGWRIEEGIHWVRWAVIGGAAAVAGAALIGVRHRQARATGLRRVVEDARKMAETERKRALELRGRIRADKR